MSYLEWYEDQEAKAPIYPRPMPREEARQIKERDKAFKIALKSQAKGTGWKHADGSIFKQEDEWFLSVLPSMSYKSGVTIRWQCKPMAIDPLFWEIFHLEENKKMPLSFRDRGAWTVRPSWPSRYIAFEETSPDKLAEAVLDWSNERLNAVSEFSVEKMLNRLGPLDKLTAWKTEAICLLILLERLDDAERLCLESDPADSGGFSASRNNGGDRFYDYALEWIGRKQGRLPQEVKSDEIVVSKTQSIQTSSHLPNILRNFFKK